MQNINLGPKKQAKFNFSVTAKVKDINTSNECVIKVLVNDRPRLMKVPVVFVGGFRWLVSDVFRKPLSLDAVFPPEKM